LQIAQTDRKFELQSFVPDSRLSETSNARERKRTNVVTTFASPRRLTSPGLLEKRVDREIERGPHRGAPNDNTEKQSDAAGQVAALVSCVPAPSSLSRRVHDLTVLSAITGVQLLWLTALGYGFFSIVS
jgi:hypothetical protein